MSLCIHNDNYHKYELECPYCKTWHAMDTLPTDEVWCEDCNDAHSGFVCPACDETFAYAGGRATNWRRKAPQP